MRVTAEQVKVIKDIFSEEVQETTYEIYLYGQRLDDRLKGGAVDLFVESPGIWSDEDQQKVKVILERYKATPCMSHLKVNMTLLSSKQRLQDTFWRNVTRAVRL
jgi:hypothetical protein